MIKVMIERHIAIDLDEQYQQVANRIMQKALLSRGFISGESLKNADDPHHRILFATYRSPSDWGLWFHSPERQEMLAELRPMLIDEEKITILEHI